MRLTESGINPLRAEWEVFGKHYEGLKLTDGAMDTVQKDLQNLITKYISVGLIDCENPYRVEAYVTVSNKIRFTYSNHELQKQLYELCGGNFEIEVNHHEGV